MRKSKKQAFSLVEVVLALGVVAFSFLAILGLIPAGMTSFRQAINTSVCSQIAQNVISDCFQADYDTLLTPVGQTQDSTIPFLMNYRFFDEEGNEIIPNPRPTSNTANANPAEPYVYLAITTVTPYIVLPGLPSNEAVGNAPASSSPQTATITVQMVFDPGQYLPSAAGSDFWGSSAPTLEAAYLLNSPKIPAGNVLTYYAHITRN